MGLQNWSTTPANNANAAPNINMATGSAPSTVHPSVRQMMADVANWYADPEWVLQADTPTYTGATTFSVPTNRTSTYSVGRRIQMAGPGSGTPYTINGTIIASAYGTVTAVTVQWDSGSLDNTVNSVAVGILQNQLSKLLSDLANTTDPTKGAAMVGFLQSIAGALGTTTAKKLQTIVDIYDVMTEAQIADAQSYTGAIDATGAFQKLAAAINTAGGGKVIIYPGKYTVGQQTFAGATGKGYAYQMADILKISGCTHPVIIECQGAIIKIASGLRFGSFDPVTGAPNSPALPNTNPDYAADVGIIFDFENNSGGVQVRGAVELDGNQANLILGGQWGDTGYQRRAYGLYSLNNASLYAENVYTHHHGTDGLLVEYDAAVDGGTPTPITLININSEYNARQGFSWISGIGLTAIGCQFNHTGKGTFASSPSAGIDIEADQVGVVRSGLFINCVCGNNTGVGMVADAGNSSDVHFMQCRFYGTTLQPIWPNMPRFRFTECLIAGQAVVAYNSPNDADRTHFTRCIFSADEVFEGIPANYGTSLADFTGQNPVFDDCDFITHQTGVCLPFTTGPDAVYRNCRMVQDGSTGLGLPRGTYVGLNNIAVTTGSIDLTSTVVSNGRLFTSGTVLGVGFLSPNGEVASLMAPVTLSVGASANNGGTGQLNQIIWSYQPPTTGAWVRGDKCINTLASVGSPKGWVCTVSGTPGTWVSEGNL